MYGERQTDKYVCTYAMCLKINAYILKMRYNKTRTDIDAWITALCFGIQSIFRQTKYNINDKNSQKLAPAGNL